MSPELQAKPRSLDQAKRDIAEPHRSAWIIRLRAMAQRRRSEAATVRNSSPLSYAETVAAEYERDAWAIEQALKELGDL